MSKIDDDAMKTAPDHELVTIRFSDVEPESLSWLWPRRVIQGKLNMLVGHPDSGKSFITIDMAARVSSGGRWPDGSGNAPLGDVIILASEDGPGDTIRPRLEAHGANLERVHYVKGIGSSSEYRAVKLDVDYPRLEETIRTLKATLVIIDPVVSFISDKVKTNDEADVRRLLQPLVDIASRTGAAIVGIMHLNKKPDLDMIQRVGGAMAFVGLARSALYVERHRHKPNTFSLSTLKLNLAKKPRVLTYHIEDAYPGTDNDLGKLVWDDQFTSPDDTDLKADPVVPSEKDRAKQFLRELLPIWGNGVPGMPAKEVEGRAKEKDISPKTLRTAREELKVVHRQVDRRSCWWLPAGE